MNTPAINMVMSFTMVIVLSLEWLKFGAEIEIFINEAELGTGGAASRGLFDSVLVIVLQHIQPPPWSCHCHHRFGASWLHPNWICMAQVTAIPHWIV
jgi:hypothetical protein